MIATYVNIKSKCKKKYDSVKTTNKPVKLLFSSSKVVRVSMAALYLYTKRQVKNMKFKFIASCKAYASE